MKKGLMIRVLLGLFLVGAAWSGGAHADANGVANKLKEKYPKLSMDAVPVKVDATGLYEIIIAGQPAYTDENVTFLLVGGELLIGAGDKVKNYTHNERFTEQESLFKTLPFSEAFRMVYGHGTRKIAVFSDPDCPFCQNFEAMLVENKAALDLTVYTFLWPQPSTHPNSTEHALYLWCSKDRDVAYQTWMVFASQRHDAPSAWGEWLQATHRPASVSCSSPPALAKINQIAGSHGFSVTPTLLFENGMTYNGGANYQILLQALEYSRTHTLKDMVKK